MNLPVTPILAADPLGHVIDKPLTIGPLDFGWLISNVTIMLALATVITFLIMRTAVKNIVAERPQTLDDYRARGVLANMIEGICLYLRDNVFRPALGEETDRHAPLLWSLFFFILVCNMLGLVPLLDLTALIGKIVGVEIGYHGHGIGGTATQSIWVTATLALVVFLYWNVCGLVKDARGWFKHLLGGAPPYMAPIMIPVEIIGMIVKPVALAIRLFANMTGGHILLAVTFVLVAMTIEGMGMIGYGVAVLPLLGAVAIYMLEILVGFIQAFVFVFLSTLFLAQMVVHEHEEHEEHEQEHAERALGGEVHGPAAPPHPAAAASQASGGAG